MQRFLSGKRRRSGQEGGASKMKEDTKDTKCPGDFQQSQGNLCIQFCQFRFTLPVQQQFKSKLNVSVYVLYKTLND